ncbi:MAG: thiosulfate sulfurtransferase [Pseudomonadota bacterium]|jgi:thiosulfate/3-mercaptopyruvate sulfurtransferase
MSDSCLIRVAELAARAADADLAVVDCRFDLGDPDWGRRGYETGHIPGAVYAPLDTALAGPVTPLTGRHPLPDPQAFARTLGAWGIGPGTPVVAYDQGHGAGAARLRWMLRAAGHAAPVRVLDGGLAAWSSAGHPLARSAAPRPPVTVPSRPFTRWLTAGEVRAALAEGTIDLVDARGADRFAGQNETIDPVAGHVPGALNRPFVQNLGPDGCFKPAAELRREWSALLGGRDASRVVTMCGSGITACQNLLALEIAGLGEGLLYAGSWSEWIRDPSRPVATTPA